MGFILQTNNNFSFLKTLICCIGTLYYLYMHTKIFFQQIEVEDQRPKHQISELKQLILERDARLAALEQSLKDTFSEPEVMSDSLTRENQQLTAAVTRLKR